MLTTIWGTDSKTMYSPLFPSPPSLGACKNRTNSRIFVIEMTSPDSMIKAKIGPNRSKLEPRSDVPLESHLVKKQSLVSTETY